MTIKGVKAIIWDLDGTLINSLVVMRAVTAELAQEKGLRPPSEDEIIKNFHGSLDDTLKSIFGISTAEELAELVDSFLAKQLKHYESPHEHLYEDSIGLAKRAASQGILQLVLTNRGHKDRGTASPRHIVGNTVLADYIHEIKCGDEIKVRKPDVRAVDDWLKKHKLSGDEVLVLGDQFIDAQLALNLGSRAVLVKRAGDIPHLENLPSGWQTNISIVESLEEIKFA